jgi:hypothetical protein
MNFSVRRKLDMAGRVRDFCRTHPSQNPGYAAAVARLEERLVRAEALAQQQVVGQQMAAGATVNKEALRLDIHKTVALLAGLAAAAAKEERELTVGIIRPDINGSHQAFLTRSRVAAATGAAHKELLIRYGMPEAFLDELNAALDRYEQALNQQHAGRAAHVGARAELEAVTSDIMLIIRQLDALNRFHFRKDAESLAAWKSARDVAWPLPPEKEAPPAGGEAQKPAA